jgi:hypothetical protein
MTENLLTQSVIKLFGRTMNDLTFTYDPSTVVTGFNNLLQRQLYNGYSGSTPTTITIDNCSVIFDSASGVGTSIVTLNSAPGSNITIDPAYSLTGLIYGMQITHATGTPPVGPSTSILPTNSSPIVTNISINYDPYPPTVALPISNTQGIGLFTISVPLVVPLIALPPAPANPTFTISDVTIKVGTPDQSPRLARIYGFSFEGAYYGLPKASIFLVHGPGIPAGNWDSNSTLEQSGVAAREWDFSGTRKFQDLNYWEYEKSDFSIRLDPEAGPLEQILLAAALRLGADMADRATPRSGQGLDTRSGQGLDIRSGQGLRR